MIKINLLPQKRPKLRVASAEPGSRDLIIGVAVLAGAAVVVFFALDQPLRSQLHDLQASNHQLDDQIAQKRDKLKGYDQLKTAFDASTDRAQAINRLMNARVVPANVLHELGEILTLGHPPTMTEEMTRKTGIGGDINKQFDLTWDPSHVWLTSYADKNGEFTIEGGAAAEIDVTQFAKRLDASVYFADVSPSHQERVADKDSGITYFRFTLTGKVAY
ncbi:MAG TPA: PilN domain-containing protein [Gammaproteobacteria bacterium]|nr:PilN domain-containing protein [Gammaproteobacteria bacterium]